MRRPRHRPAPFVSQIGTKANVRPPPSTSSPGRPSHGGTRISDCSGDVPGSCYPFKSTDLTRNFCSAAKRRTKMIAPLSAIGEPDRSYRLLRFPILHVGSSSSVARPLPDGPVETRSYRHLCNAPAASALASAADAETNLAAAVPEEFARGGTGDVRSRRQVSSCLHRRRTRRPSLGSERNGRSPFAGPYRVCAGAASDCSWRRSAIAHARRRPGSDTRPRS